MKNKIQRWLAPPTFEGDEEKTWRASLLNIAINICMTMDVLVAIGILISGRTQTVILVIEGIAFALLILMRHLLITGSVSLTATLLITLGIIVITAASASLGTIRAPSTTFLLLMVIIAGLLYGQRGLLLSTISSSLAVLGLILAENAGMLPRPNYVVTITQWVSYTTAFGLTGVLTYFAYKSLHQALEHAFIEMNERKRAEESAREQHALAEALRDTAEALNSSLKLDAVLEKILDHVEQVVHYDAMTITWVQGNQIRVLRCRGYTPEQENLIYQQNITKNEFPSFAQAIETRQPLVIPDVKSYTDWKPSPITDWGRSHLKAPIIVDAEVIGLINLHSKTPNFYNANHGRNLQTFANQVAVAIQNALLYEEVQNLATTDELTGLYNRRGFFEICRREVGRLQRFERSFSVLFVDIDHFKQFNDRYSYEVGDQVLRLVAKTLQDNVREIDVVGRYGGEEMIVLLPEINQPKTLEIAERLRKKIENLNIVSDEYGNLNVTASIGVATLIPVKGQTIALNPEVQGLILDKFISKAGQALHIAKQQGRNQVAVYDSEM